MLKEKLQIKPEEIVPQFTRFIKEKMDELEREGVILGLSGGIDSAVVATLCARAVGKGKVLALIMPERDSAQETVKDAQLVAKRLGIKYKIEDLTKKLAQFGLYQVLPTRFLLGKWKGKTVRGFHDYYKKRTGKSFFFDSLLGAKGKEYRPWFDRSNAYYRIKHRLRMVNLYWWAELKNLLVVGAANKTEEQCGFFVKHGIDAAVDLMPLLPFYKTEVRQLAGYLDVPKEIREKVPSPDIMPGITDEYALGISYEKLDLILVGLEQGMLSWEIAREVGLDEKTVEYVSELKRRSEHMRKVYIPTL